MQQQSYLLWMISALGPLYGLLLPAMGVALFVGAVLVVTMSRRPSVIASYLVFLPAPLLIGIVGAIHGMIGAYQVIATSSMAPSPAALAEGYSMALFCPLVAILISLPAYAVTAFGLLFRTVTHREPLQK